MSSWAYPRFICACHPDYNRAGYKLIYFVLHPLILREASDDTLKNKLIYFVPAAISGQFPNHD